MTLPPLFQKFIRFGSGIHPLPSCPACAGQVRQGGRQQGQPGASGNQSRRRQSRKLWAWQRARVSRVKFFSPPLPAPILLERGNSRRGPEIIGTSKKLNMKGRMDIVHWTCIMIKKSKWGRTTPRWSRPPRSQERPPRQPGAQIVGGGTSWSGNLWSSSLKYFE